MTRGSKIVISSIFGLLLLAGVYFAFFAPSPVQQPIDGVTEPSPLAGTDSLTLGPGPGLPPNSTTDSGSALGTLPGLTPSGATTGPSGTSGGSGVNGFGDLTALPPSTAPSSTAPSSTAPSESIITPVQPQPVNPPAAPTVVTTLTPPTQPTTVPPTNTPPATPAPKAAKAKATNYTTYTVKSGDTLSSISGEWFRDVTRWKDIVAVNPGLSPQSLRVGQKLNLPSKAGSPAEKLAGGTTGAKAAKSASAATAGVSQHTVAAGETLASIAAKAYGTGSSANWKRIYEANKSVIGANPSALKVGMKLVIPARQG